MTPQSGNQVSTSLGNSGLCWTVFARNRDTAVPAEGNGDLQTLICVLAARPRRCPTLLNPVPWQNWIAAYLGCTLLMKILFRGWPVTAHEMHTRRRRRTVLCVLTSQNMVLETCLVSFAPHRWLAEKIVFNMTCSVLSETLKLLYHILSFPGNGRGSSRGARTSSRQQQLVTDDEAVYDYCYC